MVGDDEVDTHVESLIVPPVQPPVHSDILRSNLSDRRKSLNLILSHKSSQSASSSIRIGYNGLGGREIYTSPRNGPFS